MVAVNNYGTGFPRIPGVYTDTITARVSHGRQTDPTNLSEATMDNQEPGPWTAAAVGACVIAALRYFIDLLKSRESRITSLETRQEKALSDIEALREDLRKGIEERSNLQHELQQTREALANCQAALARSQAESEQLRLALADFTARYIPKGGPIS